MNTEDRIRRAFDELSDQVSVSAAPADGLDRLRHRRRRRQWVLAPIAAAVVFLIVGLAVFLLTRGDESPVASPTSTTGAATTTTPPNTTAPGTTVPGSTLPDTTVPDTTPATTIPTEVPSFLVNGAGLLVTGPVGEVFYLPGGPPATFGSWSPILPEQALTAAARWDLEDGVIVQTGIDTIERVIPGTEVFMRADLVSSGGVGLTLWDVGILDGRTVALYSQATELRIVDPATGETETVAVLGDGEEGWLGASIGGGRVFAAVSRGSGCTDVGMIADGSLQPLLPVCGEPPLDYRYDIAVSPDGTHLAYLEAPWGETGREESPVGFVGPVELVIRDVDTGEELLRVQVSSEREPFASLHDFDGERILLSREPLEPASAPQSWFLIDLACGDACTQQLALTGSRGALVGNRTPASPPFDVTIDTRSCSAEGTSVTAQPGLPVAVAEMRDRIAELASTCDFAGLAQLGLEGDPRFTYSFGGDGQPLWYWMEEENRGAGVFDALVQVLEMSFSRTETQLQADVFTEIYVWPAAFAHDSWDEVPEAAREELRMLYPDLEPFEAFGAYAGWRVGITADGDWIFFVAGD